MSDTMVPRILGPSHNRLLEVTGVSDARKGTADDTSAAMLLRHGWTDYTGPARALNGWVIEGTDPDVRPRTLHRGLNDRGVNGA